MTEPGPVFGRPWTAEAREAARRLIVSTYPSPIAHSVQRLFSETANPFGLGYGGVLPVTLYLWVHVLLQDYSRRPRRDRLVAEKLSELVAGKATEGKWFELLRALAGALAEAGGAAMVPELVTLLVDSRRRPQVGLRRIEELVAARNRIHLTPPLEEQARVLEIGMTEALLGLLLEHEWMARYHFFYEEAGAPDLVSPHGIRLHGLAGLESAAAASGRMVLLAPDRSSSLSLEPFLRFAGCDGCATSFPGRSAEVFVCQEARHNRVLFRGAYHDWVARDGSCVRDVSEVILRLAERSGSLDYPDPVTRVVERSLVVSRRSVEDLVDAGKYLPEVFVAPPLWPELLEAFLEDDRPGLLVSAPAGGGKSSLLCHTARQLMDAGQVVVFWHPKNLPGPDVRMEAEKLLGEEPGRSLESVATFVRDRVGSRLVLLVDAPNERDDYGAVFGTVVSLVSALGNAGLGACAKVVATVRDLALQQRLHDLEHARRHFFGSSTARAGSPSGSVAVRLQPFTDDQCDELFERYRAVFDFHGVRDGLSLACRALLARPLMLRFAAQAFRGRSIPSSLSGEELLDAFVKERARRYAVVDSGLPRLLERALVEFARLMYGSASMTVGTDDFLDRLEELGRYDAGVRLLDILLDEGFLIVQTGAGLLETTEALGFTFEGFAEHQLAKVIAERVRAVAAEGMIGEVVDRLGRLPQLGTALRLHLRRVLQNDAPQGEEILSIVLRGDDEVGPATVGRLLGLLEAENDVAHANTVRRVLACEAPRARAAALFEAMEWAFDTGEVDRLRGLAEARESALLELDDREGRAACLVWLGDVLYNRADRYDEAVAVLEQAVALYESAAATDPRGQARVLETKYLLARVLSDRGDYRRAEQLATECLADSSAAGDENARGRALARFLLYMLIGDAQGRFALARGHLEEAERQMRRLGDRRAQGRILVNKAILLMCTADTESALAAADEAAAFCRQAADVQGKAYALLCDAAICVQKAALIGGPAREVLLARAERGLRRVNEVFKVTREDYLSTMAKANGAVLALLDEDVPGAGRLLREVIAEARTSADFFNRLDAEVLLAGRVDRDPVRLRDLLAEAEGNEYAQGMLHVHWQLWDLAADPGTRAENERRALAVADDLGWGRDPRESLYMGFYAGIFL